jgi:methylthioribose-1-phosphate isomerase
MTTFYTLRWTDGAVSMLDQRLLPNQEVYNEYRSAADVADAIRTLVVRGAPAIGCAAAWGIAVEAAHSSATTSEGLRLELAAARAVLAASRPTAVNLFWALDRMSQVAEANAHLPVAELKSRVIAEADAIQREDAESCRAMGRFGAELVPDGATILTHCNAGALATSEYGTALAVIRGARDAGKSVSVYADETRPILQGARLTAWELTKDGIPTTVLCDNMAGQLMAAGKIDLVVVGADRIAANGDTANKIGTYSVAVLAHYHGIPFYVAAPLSTIDFALESGKQIPIEHRDEVEVRVIGGRQMVPDAAQVYNPAFDVTPAALVTAIVTDRGVAQPDFTKSLAALR